ncbi:flagellar export chaperone FliS [Kineobactrum sediminis]|uniref:Flagellar secretion chaperone FliS n=2 Tax=Kineobactrum sediminis TaxID=1905677 RepID=A0A2N5Y7S2_9GAMM|nr:flagellar export chaperone FliS [Kineobactrum sediminis]
MVSAYRSGNVARAEYASPHQLVTMLFEGALERLARAIGHTERGDVAAKGECLGRVVLILDNLQASLDAGAGDGAIAGNLDDLYDYMMRRLTEANLRNDVTMMTEVQQLLLPLAEAWKAIAPGQAEGSASASEEGHGGMAPVHA